MYINDLDFADDIALFESNPGACEAQLSTTARRANEVGLRINYKKTEIMTNQTLTTPITLDGNVIAVVEDFKYLGSMMKSCETDFKVRRGQAWGAFNKMKCIWNSKNVPIKLKANIFRASVLSILLYGSESWVINDQLANSINSFATTAYRSMLPRHKEKNKKTSNKDIYKITGQLPLIQVVQERQLRFIGHCLRRDESEPINQYALYTPKQKHGHRRPGRPKKSYAQYIADLIHKEAPPTVDEIRRMAADRDIWRKIAESVVVCKPSRSAPD
jgi:hypothetical protein